MEPGTKKTAVDVEKLLQWAYLEELSKRQTSSAESIWDRLQQRADLGGVDPGHGSAQRYPHFGLPDPDAEKIEKAVGNLPDLIIDWEASREAIMGDLAAILLARDALLLRSLKTAALVTMYAIRGTRPDWRGETPRPTAIAAPKGPGRPSIVGECRGRNLYTIGSYCPLVWKPSPIDIAADRAEYAAWHRGLVLLAETLDLERHTALPPAAPAQPWNGEREPERRIYAVGESRPQRPLPLHYPRPIAGGSKQVRRPGPVRYPLDKGAKR